MGHGVSRRIVFVLVSLVSLVLAALPAATSAKVLPRTRPFDHVVVLVLENENFDTSWGPDSPAHYLNSLRSRGVFADHYFATGHASLDNYVAMMSGQPANPLTSSDCLAVNFWTCVQPQSALAGGRNFADQLEDAHLSWKGYMDSMPSPCFHADYDPAAAGPDPYQGNSQAAPAKDYADRHNPFIYFDDVVGNRDRCASHVVPYTDLQRDLKGRVLPAFSFITPDTCHDGHDDPCSDGRPGGLVSADAWLSANVPPLLDYLRRYHGLLLVTFDENGFTDDDPGSIGCCTGGPAGVAPGFGGRVGLLALGAGIPQGTVVSTAYDHMSLLRTLEELFGIGEFLNNAAPAAPMTDVVGPIAVHRS